MVLLLCVSKGEDDDNLGDPLIIGRYCGEDDPDALSIDDLGYAEIIGEGAFESHGSCRCWLG
jgi:hypothetical protein